MSAKGIGAKVARGAFYALALFVLAFILLLIASRNIFIIEIPIRFLIGWAIHAWKALPHLFGKWQEAVLPLGCLLMAAVLTHRFVRRWVSEKFPDRTWRIRQTAAVLSLLLLGSAAAIAASGVVHQMFWLVNGKVIESNMRTEILVAMSNGRQLMLFLLDYERKKGRYPNSFEELEAEVGDSSGIIRRLWWLEFRDRKVAEPWILLQPGSTVTALDDEPVIISPLLAGDGMVVVGYGDSSVRRIRADKLKEVLGQNGTKESEGGR